MSAKYCIHPGRVKSKSDGQVHYIGARQLMDLYGVDPKECVIHMHSALYKDCAKTITLRPSPSGDYSLEDINAK